MTNPLDQMVDNLFYAAIASLVAESPENAARIKRTAAKYDVYLDRSIRALLDGENPPDA